jgi:segregation and condensation protein B
MDRERQKQIVEALILAAPEPVSAAKLAGIVPGLTPGSARALVKEMGEAWEQEGRPCEVWEVAGGYQIRTRPEFAGYVKQLHQERPARLSRAALETLAVIAYKQPVTRAEVEHVRGVDAGAVLRSLIDRQLVRIAGHREVPGRPMLYGTTRRFLEIFGLERLDDLPTLRDLAELLPEGAGDAEEAAGAPEAGGEEEASAPDPEAGAGPPSPELH